MNLLTLNRIDNNTNNLYYGPINLQNIPVDALRLQTRNKISLMLNPLKIMLSDEGDFRDWRGLCSRVGLDNSHFNLLSNDSDPTGKILLLYSKQKIELANLERLQFILGIIDRYDVVDDTNSLFIEDAKIYLTAQLNKTNREIEDQSVTVEDTSNDEDIMVNIDIETVRNGLPKIKFDAFVLYADEDIERAHELYDRMIKNGYKICLKDHLVVGITFQHTAIMKLISDRCNLLILIVTPAFFRSPENKFFVNYAQALGIEQGKNKIVTCLYEKCILPEILRFYFILDYQRSGKLFKYWDKLEESLERASLMNQNQRKPMNKIQPAIEIPCSSSNSITNSNRFIELNGNDDIQIEKVNNNNLNVNNQEIKKSPLLTSQAKALSLWDIKSSLAKASYLSKSHSNLVDSTDIDCKSDDITNQNIETSKNSKKLSTKLLKLFKSSSSSDKSTITTIDKEKSRKTKKSKVPFFKKKIALEN